MRSVHPRACGEHKCAPHGLLSSFGSSPRMRGTRGFLDFGRAAGRFIPAHAGNTRVALEPVVMSNGSSPRMRGTRGVVLAAVAEVRFIPAHAGNTRARKRTIEQQTVHPRACGEHIVPIAGFISTNGSSPRMRGTLFTAAAPTHRRRFIPAHAGNTARPAAHLGELAVHPRACGEHNHPEGYGLEQCGSSPRMRGTQNGVTPALTFWRFIPAHAGNTGSSRSAEINFPVHPRACGEHLGNIIVTTEDGGSSPRMRGTRGRAVPALVPLRFIPAHAGNTLAWSGGGRYNTVHPRACGEHFAEFTLSPKLRGSSPRMRGTPRSGSWNTRGIRFIPAHAGNTLNRRVSSQTVPVHPRACGEHSVPLNDDAISVGSSPRMRGTLNGHRSPPG